MKMDWQPQTWHLTLMPTFPINHMTVMDPCPHQQKVGVLQVNMPQMLSVNRALRLIQQMKHKLHSLCVMYSSRSPEVKAATFLSCKPFC